MTNNEKELLNIIHQHSNPEKALKIALDLIVDFSKNFEAPQDTSSVLHQEAS
jgi:hypothetical protein